MRLLLFDVDGTLVWVDGAGREALRAAMGAVYGETGPIDEYDFRGRTDPAIVRGLLRAAGRDDAWIERGFARLWPIYGAVLERELKASPGRARSCPGVPELLTTLERETNWVWGLLTGNVEEGAWRKLRACGLASRFSFGAFGSDAEARVELPAVAVERARAATGFAFSVAEVVVIGDTPEDIFCARAAGARSVAVATGGYTPDELRGCQPDAVLPDLADPARVLEAVGRP